MALISFLSVGDIDGFDFKEIHCGVPKVLS